MPDLLQKKILSLLEARCLRLTRPLQSCSAYSVFYCTVEFTLIIIYRETLPHLPHPPVCQCICEMLRVAVSFVVTLWLLQKTSTGCGRSFCPIFTRCCIGETGLSSPLLHRKRTQTGARTHTQKKEKGTHSHKHVTTLGQAFINLG